MKVCWFTNVPLPSASRALGRKPSPACGWLTGLSQALLASEDVEIRTVSFVAAEEDAQIFAEGIDHCLVGIPRKRFAEELWFSPSEKTRRKCRELLSAFGPDVVHIHGTEYTYGLLFAQGDIAYPTVVSLQGFMRSLLRPQAYGMTWSDTIKSHTIIDWLRRRGILHMRWNFARKEEAVERHVLSSPAHFVGRTRFDRACLHSVNPNARYFHCDEVMRRPFYTMERNPDEVLPRSIFFVGSNTPYKGFHCLLKSVALLREEYPDIRIRATGKRYDGSWRAGGYSKFIHRLIHELRLDDRVAFLGELSAEEVAGELARAELFACPYFSDNSPNAIAESMLVGTPVVAASAGGIPSMVRDGETALCFPANDEIVMAECIRMLYRDPALANRLAAEAKIVARERHDPGKIARTMMDIYRQASAPHKANETASAQRIPAPDTLET
ncbi:MAG: glycosyltransferase family 4 protein [Pirellulales bacterium]|nr:glycosyltransferase family 4 protein [Pirellulales bacterium]